MHSDLAMRGVWTALATPLDSDGGLDAPALASHAVVLLAAGCDGVAPFGTTGEGPSFSVVERQAGLEALLAAGVGPDQIVTGVGAASLADAVGLARHALSVGVPRFLMLPPFYYKDVGDDGVYAAFARFLDAVGDDRARLLLYHIPQVSQVPVTATVIRHLLASHPRLLAGIKDSTGDLPHTLSLAKGFPAISVFCGAEDHLPELLAAGGAGTICGLANLVPRLMTRLRDSAGSPRADEPQARISALIRAVTEGQFVPRLKALLAAATGNDRWRHVRPPLTPLSHAAEAQLLRAARGSEALRDDWPALTAVDPVMR